MADERKTLTELLRRAGISNSAITAAWPSWWNEEAAASPSGRAELRFALARKLGLQAKPFLGERVEFTWNDEARFKHLTTDGKAAQAALSSYGITIGRLLIRAAGDRETPVIDALTLRNAILENHPFVDLQSLIATCWAVGIPVIHLRVFPLETKSMHAMVVTFGGRFAVLLGRDSVYPAPIAFTLAHEIGHILLKHLQRAPALIDMEDPADQEGDDSEEKEADLFALTLLTGSSDPDIRTNIESFNAPSLAQAVLAASSNYRIEPGTLALCLAYKRNAWKTANASLKYIYADEKPVWREVNGIARLELNWNSLSEDSAQFLQNVMAE